MTMGKENVILIILVILIIGIFFYFQPFSSDIKNNNQILGELNREVPSETNSGGTFIINYSTDKTGTWVVIIEDSVSGGCKFPNGKSEYKSVILGEPLQIVEITAPLSGSCTFSGDYNFVSDKEVGKIKNFPDQTVNIK